MSLPIHRTHLELSQLLRSLFPTPSFVVASCELEMETILHRRLAGLMCGAFSAREANAAAKTVGLDPMIGLITFRQIRLACLDHIDFNFSSWYRL